jgi:hypothetical protein
MLLLAYLLTADHRLRNARVRLMTVVNNEQEEREAGSAVGKVIRSARLTARARVIRRGDRSIPAIMKEESGGCDLAIVGFKLPDVIEHDTADTFFERMNAILAELPTTLLVHSARDFKSEPVLFDS